MIANEENEHESLYPADCHFKIICVQTEGIAERVEHALRAIGVEESIQEGNSSSEGTYVTFNISIHILERSRMVEIDLALKAVDGVRMVL